MAAVAVWFAVALGTLFVADGVQWAAITGPHLASHLSADVSASLVAVPEGGSKDANPSLPRFPGGRPGLVRRGLSEQVGTNGAASSAAASGAAAGMGADGRSLALHGPAECTLRWRRELSAPCDGAAVVGNSTLVLACGDTLSALDAAAAGSVRWQVRLALPAPSERYAVPVLSPDGELVFVDSGHGTVIALAVASGARRWTHDLDAGAPARSAKHSRVHAAVVVALPEELAARAVVVFGATPAADSGLFVLSAVDCHTGILQWKYVVPSRPQLVGPATSSGRAAGGGPIVASADGAIVFVAAGDGHLHAVDTLTGYLRWRYWTGTGAGHPVPVGRDAVAAVAWDGVVHCVNGSTGAALWKFAAATADGRTIPVTSVTATPDGRNLVVVSPWGDRSSYRVALIDAATGAPAAWLYDSPEPFLTGPVFAAAADGAGLALFTTAGDRALRALDLRTGVARWVFRSPAAAVHAPPAVADGSHTAYASAGDRLHALDVTTGRPLWEAGTGAVLTGAPAVGPDRVVYFVTAQNVVAIDAVHAAPCPAPGRA